MDKVQRGLNQALAWYRHSCYRRNHFWGLTPEQFAEITAKDCAYCGRKPANKTHGFIYNGIDRKDNSKGYHPLNVVACCWSCNKIKGGQLTYEEMMAAMRVVLDLRSK